MSNHKLSSNFSSKRYLSGQSLALLVLEAIQQKPPPCYCPLFLFLARGSCCSKTASAFVFPSIGFGFFATGFDFFATGFALLFPLTGFSITGFAVGVNSFLYRSLSSSWNLPNVTISLVSRSTTSMKSWRISINHLLEQALGSIEQGKLTCVFSNSRLSFSNFSSCSFLVVSSRFLCSSSAASTIWFFQSC